jgi:hypothetical protein
MKKINKNINSLIVFILFSLSYYLFFLSLEKCFEGEDLCCTKLKWIERKVIEEILSCLLITISLAIIIKKKLSKLHLIHLIILKNIIDCNDWEKGLNNTSIDNNPEKYECIIKTPKLCPYKIGKFFFDRFINSSENCYKNMLNSRKNILKFSKSPYINENTLHIGYPLINKEERAYLSKNYYSLRTYISETLIDMNI